MYSSTKENVYACDLTRHHSAKHPDTVVGSLQSPFGLHEQFAFALISGKPIVRQHKICVLLSIYREEVHFLSWSVIRRSLEHNLKMAKGVEALSFLSAGQDQSKKSSHVKHCEKSTRLQFRKRLIPFSAVHYHPSSNPASERRRPSRF